MTHPVLTALGLSDTESGTYLGSGEWSHHPRRRRDRADQPEQRRGAGAGAGLVAGRLRHHRRARAGRLQGVAHHAGARAAARRSACAPTRCARTRTRSARWSRWRWARSKPEGDGEVQEMIDIGDFAVGLSRQLYGLTMHSERPGHRMYEQWHPIGIVGVITAFNFPVAVWAWNSFLAAVCGDITIWKPSPKTPLSAIASMKICNEALQGRRLPGHLLPVQRCRHRAGLRASSTTSASR